MDEGAQLARLSALAHEVRLRVFRLLVNVGAEGMASGDIATELDVPATAMSFHLASLERSGLIGSRREGRFVRYAIRAEAVRDLIAFLTRDCCGGRPELCGFKPRRSLGANVAAAAAAKAREPA